MNIESKGLKMDDEQRALAVQLLENILSVEDFCVLAYGKGAGEENKDGIIVCSQGLSGQEIGLFITAAIGKIVDV